MSLPAHIDDYLVYLELEKNRSKKNTGKLCPLPLSIFGILPSSGGN